MFTEIQVINPDCLNFIFLREICPADHPIWSIPWIREHIPRELATSLVSIQKNDSHKCGGALIDPDFVLTVTACQTQLAEGQGEMTVVIGIIDEINKVRCTIKSMMPVLNSPDLLFVRVSSAS